MKLPLRVTVGGYCEYVPPAALAHITQAIWIHRTPDGIAETSHRVVPDPEMSIAFSCHRGVDGRAAEPCLVLLGSITRPRPFTVTAGYEMVAIRLRVECIKRLLDIAPRDFCDAIIDLHEIAPRIAAPLFGALCATRSAREALAVLTARVGALADHRDEWTRPSTAQALMLLRRSRGRLPIEALAQATGTPVRTLRRRLLEDADVTPKAYARTLRFLHAIDRIDRTAARPDWARLALDAGYCDQSHLVRDFHALSGLTPGEVWLERKSEPSVTAEAQLVLVAEKSNPAAAI